MQVNLRTHTHARAHAHIHTLWCNSVDRQVEDKQQRRHSASLSGYRDGRWWQISTYDTHVHSFSLSACVVSATRPYLGRVEQSGAEQQEAERRHATDWTHTQTHTDSSDNGGRGRDRGRGREHGYMWAGREGEEQRKRGGERYRKIRKEREEEN